MHTTILVPLTEMGQVLQQAERTMAKRNRKKLDYDRFKLGDKVRPTVQEHNANEIYVLSLDTGFIFRNICS